MSHSGIPLNLIHIDYTQQQDRELKHILQITSYSPFID